MDFYIRRVRVSGLFNQSNELVVDFNQSINCIFGANGTGKTALINLIVNALLVNRAGLIKIPFDSISILISEDKKRQPENYVTVFKEWETIDYQFYNKQKIKLFDTKKDAVLEAGVRYRLGKIQYSLKDLAIGPNTGNEVVSVHASILRNAISGRLSLTYVPLLRHNIAFETDEDKHDISFWSTMVEKNKEFSSEDPNVRVLKELQAEISKKYASAQSAIARRLESLSSTIFEKLLLTEESTRSSKEPTQLIRNLLYKSKIDIDEDKIVSVISQVMDLKLNIHEDKIRSHYATWSHMQEELLNTHRNMKSVKEDEKELVSEKYSEAYFNLLASARLFNKFEEAIKEIQTVHFIKIMLLASFDHFVQVVNEFLSETKSLCFNDSGQFIFKNGQREIDISDLSSGEKHLVAILGRVCFSSSDGTSIFIADEPELSLHLEWQRKIMPAIKKLSPNTQVIVATHAPAIITKDSNKINIQSCYKNA